MKEDLINQLKPAPILVAGDVMVDEYIVGDVERISPESPVPVLLCRNRLRRLGGAGNVVQNIVSLGGRVALFATVGKDSPGRWFRRHCEQMAVESFWLRDDPTRPTTIKTRVVARNQQLIRIDEEHVGNVSAKIESLVIEDVESVMPQVRAVIISDYGKGFLTDNIVRALIDTAAVNKVPVLVDPKGRDFSKYRGTTYITPNQKEAALASGIEIRNKETLTLAGKVLLEQVLAEGVIITRGREGSTLVTPERTQDFPVKSVEIIDVTGAGDTLIATLALAVANGLGIDSAISLANLAASLVVSRFGAACVTTKEMVASLNRESIHSKLVGAEDISRMLEQHRILGQQIVFTNGCFDLFHSGHLEILRRSAAMGDVLVVGVNSDSSVSRLKGPGRPIVGQDDRVALISAPAFVDYVVIFDDDTPLELIKAVLPNVLVKGEDWRGKKVVGEDVVKARGGKVEFVKHVGGMSTSALIKKIKEQA